MSLEFWSESPSKQPSDSLWSVDVPAVGPFIPGRLSLREGSEPIAADHQQAAQLLAEQLGMLVTELHATLRTLWQREAELATAIPLVVYPAEQQHELAERFEAVLKGAADAIKCQSAAMYILDDDTRHLKMRAHWGLAHARFTAPPRPLRSARADIEALAGHAVTLADTSEFLSWNVPEACASAVCVPISTATMPLGTMWLFGDQIREFSDVEVNIAEIIAGRLATELEREVLLREQDSLSRSKQSHPGIQWQHDGLPEIPLVTDQWQLAARPSTRSRMHGDHYQWRMDKSGRLNVVLATAHSEGLASSLTAASIAGLLHRGTPVSPTTCLNQINELLYAGSTGDRRASVFCGRLAATEAALEFASAGNIDAFVIRPHGWESICATSDSPAGGWEGNLPSGRETVEIEPDDVLLVVSGKPRLRPRLLADAPIDATHYAELLLHHSHLPVEEMVTLMASQWEHSKTIWDVPPAVLVAKRRASRYPSPGRED